MIYIADPSKYPYQVGHLMTLLEDNFCQLCVRMLGELITLQTKECGGPNPNWEGYDTFGRDGNNVVAAKHSC
jgi:hypothetical protein